MQGMKRRIVYVVLFEVIAIAVTGVALAASSDRPAGAAWGAAVGSSAIAMLWNLAYNALFERWEARQARKGRGFWRRVVHAIGFELGLIVLLVPLFAVALQVSLWQALVYDIGLTVFFLVYAFVFNLAFDRVFGLPAAALAPR